MEDSSLDDFFAKKDKSKKKTKTAAKFTTSDILAKQSDQPKKSSKKKKDKDASNQSSSSKTKKAEEDDEWKDFQEEEAKDFSDLKIANLNIALPRSDDDADRAGDGSGSDNEDGEGRDKREGASGPWNKATGSDAPAPEVIEEAPPPPPPKEEAPKVSGKYVPPGARRAAMDGTPQPMSRRRKKEAPNVMSEVDFPTLGGMGGSGSLTDAGLEREKSNAPAQFEQVRGGGRQTEDPRLQSSKVEVGNKFDALTNEDD